MVDVVIEKYIKSINPWWSVTELWSITELWSVTELSGTRTGGSSATDFGKIRRSEKSELSGTINSDFVT